MIKKLLNNKKAQQTAEYALLISLVVAAVVAMQTYAQRSLQGRIRDAAGNYMVTHTDGLGDTRHYEPYYLDSGYVVTRDDETIDTDDGSKARVDGIRKDQETNTVRTGGKTTTWDQDPTAFR